MITRLAIQKDRITWICLLLIVLGGVNAYRTLPQAEDPGFIIRTAVVMTWFPGASPQRVEELVTDKIEEVVQEIPELDFIESQSRTGFSLVNVNIRERYTDMRPIFDNLRRKVDKVRADLPEGIRGPIVDDEVGDIFGIVLSLTGEGFSYAEMKSIADEVRDELLRIEDAAKVEIYGDQEERIFVEYEHERLAELELSVSQLKQSLESQNITNPGGQILIDRERITLEPSGNLESLEDLANTLVRLPGSEDVLFLRDIAEIRRGYVDPQSTEVLVSGVTGLALGISLREGGNILTLGSEVSEAIRRLQSQYPIGIEFDLMADQPSRVEKKVDEFVSTLLQAIGLVILVMLFTLGLRTGLLVASLIPMAMLMTLMVMGTRQIGLDQMSLAALIIALGMLIDNAIVMSESVMVQMSQGKTAFEAAVASGKELQVPLLTSTLTTSAAFSPLYLAKSSSGEYVGVIFVVVTITLICSWILSLTMTPMLCVRFLRVESQTGDDTYDSAFYRTYRALLLGMLRRKTATMCGLLLLVVAAGFLFTRLPVIFFPKADRSFYTAQLYLPTGTAFETTQETVRKIHHFIQEELRIKEAEGEGEGVTHWITFIGGGEPRYILTHSNERAKPSYAFMILNTSSFEVVGSSIGKLRDYLDKNFPDLSSVVSPSDLGPPVASPVQIRLSGRDYDELFAIADRLKERLRQVSGTYNVADDWGLRTKKLFIRIDQTRAQLAGVSSLDIAISLQSLLDGVATTEFREGNDIIPVILRSVEADRKDIGKLDSLSVYSQSSGHSVPLKQVADVEVLWEPSSILRRNRLRTVTVECNLNSGVTAAAVNEQLAPWLEEDRKQWPRGYLYETGGEVESAGKANQSIGAQLPVAGMFILLLLVLQFNSVRRPLIIVSTIPLGIIGVVFGLHLFRSYFGFMTLLGIVSLAGIVINNAIVLLDRIRIEQEENGLTPQEAILAAAQKRLRPILLTTLTTIGGLIPLYLGGGPMWEPMAIAIMTGLLFATALTLGVVPTLYAIAYRISFKEHS